MRKKTTILATACVIIVVVVFFDLCVFKTPTQQATTVSIVMSEPSAWVNRSVVVEGNMSLFEDLGWYASPWNYNLYSNGTFIGVSWYGNLPRNYNLTVIVSGTVKGGYWTHNFGNGTFTSHGPIAYFIEAETIEPL